MAEKVYEPAGGASTELAVRAAEKIWCFRRQLLLAIGVLVAATAVFAYRRHAAAVRETEAENSVYRSEMDLLLKPDTDASAIFARDAKEFAGLSAGVRALLIKFSHDFNNRNFAEAERAARDLIAAYPENYFLPRAKLALAQALLMQDKLSESETLLRELTRAANPEIFPKAKLALAQNLERRAEAIKDNPEEYLRRLEAAEEEYNDIVARSRITVPAQRGFWPQAVVYPADFALVVIKDKLSGYRHPEPMAAPAPPPAAAKADPTAAPRAEASSGPAAEKEAGPAE
ncbi:MAG: hypothetical protein LBU23_11115 [Planctomycetota bacterium]|jgi:predicted negative regulator of RcsB-dependent stress response|nr:hypothetical protein [Planctomycetota bacterium]